VFRTEHNSLLQVLVKASGKKQQQQLVTPQAGEVYLEHFVRPHGEVGRHVAHTKCHTRFSSPEGAKASMVESFAPLQV
jgi:hypothetical protein